MAQSMSARMTTDEQLPLTLMADEAAGGIIATRSMVAFANHKVVVYQTKKKVWSSQGPSE